MHPPRKDLADITCSADVDSWLKSYVSPIDKHHPVADLDL